MKLVSQIAALRSVRCAKMLVAVCLVACFTSTLHGQANYEVLPLHKINNKEISNWNELSSFMREESKSIGGMLEGGNVNQAAFDGFFNDVVFPMFTHEKNYDHPSVSTAKTRQKFKALIVAKAKNPAAKERLFDLTLAKMDQIATGNFDPRARINAVLMVAELNDPEPGPPLKKGLPYLVKWSADPKMVDVVRVPAFRGVLRHAATPNAIDAAQRSALVKSMLAIVKQHTASAEQSLEGHEWTLRRAVDVLAVLGEPGDKGAVYTELVALVEDEAAPRSARGTAAAALAKIRFTPPKDFDAESVAKALGKLAVSSYKAELAEAKAKHRPIAVDRLKQQLAEVRTGLVGADGKSSVGAMLKTDAQKKFAADLIAQTETLAKACDTKRAEPPDPLIAQQTPGYVPGVPFDTQEPIAKAISTAGGSLEGVLQAGVGGNAAPAGGLPGELPPGPAPEGSKTVGPPMGTPALPPG
jgi:hypothetical protein